MCKSECLLCGSRQERRMLSEDSETKRLYEKEGRKMNLNKYVLSDLKKMNNQELLILSDEIRKEIINTVSKCGGHLSSNLTNDSGPTL